MAEQAQDAKILDALGDKILEVLEKIQPTESNLREYSEAVKDLANAYVTLRNCY